MDPTQGRACLSAFVQAAASIATKVPHVRLDAEALARVLPPSVGGCLHSAVVRAAPMDALLEHEPLPALFCDARAPERSLLSEDRDTEDAEDAEDPEDPELGRALVALERLLGGRKAAGAAGLQAARAAMQLVGVAIMHAARDELLPALLFVGKGAEFMRLGMIVLDAPVQAMEIERGAGSSHSSFLRQLLVCGGEPDPEEALRRWGLADALWRRTAAAEADRSLQGLEDAMQPPFERCMRGVRGVLPFLRLSAPATLAQVYQCEAALVRALRFHRAWGATLSEHASNEDLHAAELGFEVAATALMGPLRAAAVFQGGGVGASPDAALGVLRAEAQNARAPPLSTLERRSVVAYSEPRGAARLLAGVTTALALGVTAAATAGSSDALLHAADTRPQFDVNADELAAVIKEAFERVCADTTLAKPRHLTRDCESIAPPQFESEEARARCLKERAEKLEDARVKLGFSDSESDELEAADPAPVAALEPPEPALLATLREARPFVLRSARPSGESGAAAREALQALFGGPVLPMRVGTSARPPRAPPLSVEARGAFKELAAELERVDPEARLVCLWADKEAPSLRRLEGPARVKFYCSGAESGAESDACAAQALGALFRAPTGEVARTLFFYHTEQLMRVAGCSKVVFVDARQSQWELRAERAALDPLQQFGMDELQRWTAAQKRAREDAAPERAKAARV